MTRFNVGFLALAALSIASFEAANAADGLNALIHAQQGKAQIMDEEPVVTPVKQAVKKLVPGKLGGGKIKGDAVSELSAQDCKNVGGAVITVTDNRCGSSGKYCRMPDTNAVCIDKVN